MESRKSRRTFVGLLVAMSLLSLAFLSAAPAHGVSSLNINFSGKIVTSEGFDISEDEPSCILEEADICDFKIKFYDDDGSGSGTLLGEELFENVELGDYRGFFNLKIGGGSFTAGEHGDIKEIFLNEEDVYVELLFDGSGENDFHYENEELETFVVSQEPLERMLIGASPYSISSRGAIDDFQLKVKDTLSSGDSKGLMYFDGGDNQLMVHDGTSWRSLGYSTWDISSDDIFFDGGNIAMGTDSFEGGYVLTVDGDSFFSGDMVVDTGGLQVDGLFRADGNVRMTDLLSGSETPLHIDADGYLVIDSSSERFKSNVESHDSVLSKLANLELVNFTWNENTGSAGKGDIGMIAEEVKKHIPELVTYNSFGQVQGLKYDRMGAFAVAGLGELKDEFDSFRNEFDVDEKVYTSEEEMKVGSLVSRDFVGDEDILPFENANVPLYGIISEVLEIEEVEGEDEEEEIFEYKVTKYQGVGEYEVLIYREDIEEEFEEEFGIPVYYGVDGVLKVLDDEKDDYTMLAGQTLEALEFEEDENYGVFKVHLIYSPIKFGSESLSFSSLFSNSVADSLTFGGGHVNFKGNRGEFNILETKMLTVTEQLLIYDHDESGIQILKGDDESYDLLERISELEKRLLELEEESVD